MVASCAGCGVGSGGPDTRLSPPAVGFWADPLMWAAGSQARQLLMGVISPRRRLQEEDPHLRTSSLPAIPNPFPELCGPGSPPALTPGSLPPGPAAAKQVSPALDGVPGCSWVERGRTSWPVA